VSIFHLTFVRISQIGNLNEPITHTISSRQAVTDAFSHVSFIRIVAVILYHQLHITEDRFHGIVIRTCLGQADPMRMKFARHLPRHFRFARMCTILIEHHPDFGIGIPMMDVLHKATDRKRIFSVIITPDEVSFVAFIGLWLPHPVTADLADHAWTVNELLRFRRRRG